MSAALRKMRAALYEYLDNGVGPTPSTRTLFANHPAESDELLKMLFAEYDAGDKTDLEIEALLRIRLVTCLVHTEKSRKARARQHALDVAYAFPPICKDAIFMALRFVSHHDEDPAQCENLVRDYPAAAAELLTTLLVTKTHERFYARTRDESAHSQVEIDTLRAMIARTVARRIMDEMGSADGSA